MTAAQLAAFTTSVDGQFDPASLSLVIAMLTGTVALTWLAWLGTSAYSGLARGTTTLGQLMLQLGRGIFLVLLLGYFIR